MEAPACFDGAESDRDRKRRKLPDAPEPMDTVHPAPDFAALRERLVFFHGAWRDTLGPAWRRSCEHSQFSKKEKRAMVVSTGVVMEYTLVLFMVWSRRHCVPMFNAALQRPTRLAKLGDAMTTAVTFLMDSMQAHVLFRQFWGSGVIADRAGLRKEDAALSECEAHTLEFLSAVGFEMNQPFYDLGTNYTPQHVLVTHVGRDVLTKKFLDAGFTTVVLDVVLKTYEHWGLDFVGAEHGNDDDARRAVDLAAHQGYEELRSLGHLD